MFTPYQEKQLAWELTKRHSSSDEEKLTSVLSEAKDTQSSIRSRVIDAKANLSNKSDIVSIEYIPKTGKNKGRIYEQFYKGDKCRLFAWLSDTCDLVDDVLYKKEMQGTNWDFTSSINNLTKEGDVLFSSGKKPEALVSRIIDMTTNKGDIILDYHLGSGTTVAAAHKMGQRYIGIEQMDYIETVAVERLRKVIGTKKEGTMFGDEHDCDQGGISKGGGSFVYCELAKANQNFVDEISAATTKEQLTAIWERMQQSGFLSWKINPSAINDTARDFADLSTDDTRRFLIESLDKNLLYIPLSEIDNTEFAITDTNKTLNSQFYGN